MCGHTRCLVNVHLMCFPTKLPLTGQHTDVTLGKHLVKESQMIGEDLVPFSSLRSSAQVVIFLTAPSFIICAIFFDCKIVLFPHDQPIVLLGLSFIKSTYTVRHRRPGPGWEPILLLLAIRFTIRFALLMRRNESINTVRETNAPSCLIKGHTYFQQ